MPDAIAKSLEKVTSGKRNPFALAINELQNSLDVVETNAPINEKEGNVKQAALEKNVARSIGAAISKLNGTK